MRCVGRDALRGRHSAAKSKAKQIGPTLCRGPVARTLLGARHANWGSLAQEKSSSCSSTQSGTAAAAAARGVLHPHSAGPAFGQATPTLYSGPRAPASASLYLQHDLTDVLRAAPQPSGGPVMQTFADIDSYVDQKHCEGSRKHTFFFSAELELFTSFLQAWGAEQQRPSGGGDDDGGSSGPSRPRRGAAGSSSQEQGSQEQNSRVADMLRGTGYTLKWVLAAFDLLVPAGGGDPLLCRRVTYKGQPTLRALKAIEELLTCCTMST